ncbi:MAG: pyruvate kinase [Mycoplasmoidaceae bacterium]|nr:pyruvate kinase [Mycoplasmoidaceae bacterium]
MLNDPKNAASKKLAYQTMEEIIKSGVNCVRLNFSHGSYEEQSLRIKIAREVANKLKKNISIMLDTKGPEIRLGKFKKDTQTVEMGSKVIIYTKKNIVGDTKQFFATDSTGKYNMANDVKVGGIILVNDGKLQLKIDKVNAKQGLIYATALNSGVVGEKKRINLPDTMYTMPFMSEKDKKDVQFAIDNNLDYIAASFVNSKENVNEIRAILKKNKNNHIQIISKIETTHAIKNIDEIIKASDGIMVARGDLALEIPYYDVPYWEKYMIRKCRYVGKPVIVATQMLDSLERNIQPTRAEVTDVFFAVERGADSTMLSGESAQGLFPVRAVSTMAAIDVKSELLFDYNRALTFYFPKAKLPIKAKIIAQTIATKLLPYGSDVAPSFPYEFVTLFTNDVDTIRAVSNIRPAATIVVITDKNELLTAFGINYAIQTYFVNNLTKAKKDYNNVSKLAVKGFKSNPGKTIAFIDNKFKVVK